MSTYSVAIIGTGPDPETNSHEGYSMGYRHAWSYRATDGCELRACADIVSEHAADFVEEFDLPIDAGYTDHKRMLDEVEPDIVSICTPPATHLDLVVDCARHDAVRAVHCEKPMAVRFGACQRMLRICEEEDCQLTVNLQNRCTAAVKTVREWMSNGEIGEIERIELGRHDLLQTGIHHIDLANFLMDDEPVNWILGQIDYPEENTWYTDMRTEAQSLGMWEYESGVHGLCSTGKGMDAVGRSVNRILGTDGQIEMDLDSYDFEMRTYDSGGWEPIEFEEPTPQDDAIEIIVDSVGSDDEPLVSGAVGLAATEIVFGIWESARQRGRVFPPLEMEDNPLESLVRSGELPPNA